MSKSRPWSRKRLDEIASIGSGATPPATSGNCVVMGANGPIGTANRHNLTAGYLVGRVGSAGAVSQWVENVWASDNTLTVAPRAGVDGRFLGHLLRFMDPTVLVTQTAQPLVTQTGLGRMEALVPPEGEQRQIAKILDTLDDQTRLIEGVRDKHRAIKIGLLPTLLNPSSSAKNLAVNKWEVGRLSELVGTITSGITPESGDPRYYDTEGVPFVMINDLTAARGHELTHTSLCVTEAALCETGLQIYPVGTLLVSMYGTIGLVKVLATRAAANQAISALLPPFGCDPRYLYHYLEWIRPKWTEFVGQTTQANINGKVVKTMPVSLPSLSEQRQIAEMLGVLDGQIRCLDQHLDKLRDTKTGLMSDLLSGRVRVPEGMG